MNAGTVIHTPDTESLRQDSLDQYLAGIKNLPPTPEVLIKLIQLFQQPDRDADEIVGLARRDPPLAAEVLRRCNNLLNGTETQVVDIHEAVFHLGFYEVYRLTVLLFGMRTLGAAEPPSGIPLEIFRRHSSITAIAAGVIASETGESEGLAFTAGLLHDIGKVVLATAESARYATLLHDHGHQGFSLCEAEKSAFGFHHGEIGARLLARWGVPEIVSVPALLHHHTARSGQYKRPVAIINLANLLAHHIAGDGPREWFKSPDARRAAEVLDIPFDDLIAIKRAVYEQVKQQPSLLMC